ncbi:MAG: hypothetical protein ACHQFX_03345 [Chitinophagales bacterium]
MKEIIVNLRHIGAKKAEGIKVNASTFSAFSLVLSALSILHSVLITICGDIMKHIRLLSVSLPKCSFAPSKII